MSMHLQIVKLNLHILVDLFSSLPYFAIFSHFSHMTMPQDVLSFIKIKNLSVSNSLNVI